MADVKKMTSSQKKAKKILERILKNLDWNALCDRVDAKLPPSPVRRRS